MIPTIEDIVAGLASGQYSIKQALGWLDAHLEMAAEIALADAPRSVISPTDWKYCPECGSVEFKEGEKRERWCSPCGQAWFPHIDYTDVVQGHLKNQSAPVAPQPTEQAFGFRAFDCHFDGDWKRCDKDCAKYGLCKRRTSDPLIPAAPVAQSEAEQDVQFIHALATFQDTAEPVAQEPVAWDACLVCRDAAGCASRRVCDRTKDKLDKCDDGATCANTSTGCWNGGCIRRKPVANVTFAYGLTNVIDTELPPGTKLYAAPQVAVPKAGPQSVEATAAGLNFCCSLAEENSSLIAKQRNVVNSILHGAHPKEAWNRVMGDEKFSDAPAYVRGQRWFIVPGEIDRSKHRPVLGAWNACMAGHETLEMVWPKLVRAIAGGGNG